ncbi:hypothetical protein D0Z03_002842, partial [Geotrichum reessii]
ARFCPCSRIMHRSVLPVSFDATTDPLQKSVSSPTGSYVIYQDLPHDDDASSSDDDADGPAEQDTLTILNMNLSNSRSIDTLKDASISVVPAATAAEPAKPRPSAPKLDKIDTSRTTLNHRKHRATHSTSSASSTGAPHHHYFHLNLPPCSPASPQSLSPHSSARSPSPRRKPTHRPMSSIGSTLSSGSSSSVAPGKFVFPPPTLSAPIASNEPELELDYSLCFSPTLSDEGGASPYIHQAQNDLQGIFNTLAHKERRLLEAREQLMAAEKDLNQFKSQWDSVLGPDSAEVSPPSKAESPETPVVEVVIPLSSPAPTASESHHRMYNNHKKTSSVASVPDVSTHSRRMLSMRHSIGHASELGFDIPKAAPDLLGSKDGSSSFLGNFSYYFREKLSGLFEQQQQHQYQNQIGKRLDTKNSVTSLRSAASFHTLSPATSLSSLSSRSLNDTVTNGGTSDSFIGRFLVNPVSAVDHHSTLFPKSSLTVRSPYLGPPRLASPPSDLFYIASAPTSTPKTPTGPLCSPFVAKQT